jgi:outer membrane lipoprotein-sorting protein
MKWVRLLVLALMALPSFVGCATAPPASIPTDVILPHRSAEWLLSPLDRQWHTVNSLRAMARLTVTSHQGRFSTRQTFLWQRPSLLRLDVVSILGQPAMALVADAHLAAIYYPQEGIFFQGPATAANLVKFIGLPLDAQDVAHLLTGFVRPTSAQPGARVAVQVDRGAYLVRFLGPRGDLMQDVWIEPSQGLPSRIVRYASPATPVVDVAYTDFRVVGDSLSFPFQVTVWLPGSEAELRVQFLSVDVNPELSPMVFELSPPGGVQVVPFQ